MASRLYNYFYTGYKSGTISEEQLTVAVSKNYITEDEKNQIMAA